MQQCHLEITLLKEVSVSIHDIYLVSLRWVQQMLFVS